MFSKILSKNTRKKSTLAGFMIIHISESFREPFIQLMGLHDGETVVIPNGIDINHFLEIDDLIWGIIDKYQLLKKFPLILSPVNILERKNIDYCLDIIHELKKT